jgi:thiamine biosynthesis lipoprotein
MRNLLLAAFVLGFPGGPAPHPNAVPPAVVERQVSSMGTVLGLDVVAATREQALAASEEAVVEVRRVEDLLTTWRDSPLLQLDEAPVARPVPLDTELFGLLETVFEWAERTDGAFDPTLLPLVRAWDLRRAGRVPPPEALARALLATGTHCFRLDPAARTATRLDALAGIEEGAWGKGYALDRAAARLEDSGVSGLLDLGGQVVGRGRDGAGRTWVVGIADPRRRDREVVALEVANASASTSGNSERSRVVAGRRIGHLLDPRTGEPAADFGSATVVAASALEADILSTALFVLGPEAGLALSRELRREGFDFEVLFLVVSGDRLEARFSPGIPRLVRSADGTTVDGLPIFKSTQPRGGVAPCIESHGLSAPAFSSRSGPSPPWPRSPLRLRPPPPPDPPKNASSASNDSSPRRVRSSRP